jgi:hypothetical protein
VRAPRRTIRLQPSGQLERSTLTAISASPFFRADPILVERRDNILADLAAADLAPRRSASRRHHK